MNRLDSYSKRLMWFIAFMLTAFVAGCGGGGGGRDPILGTGGNAVLVPTPPTVIAVAPLAGAIDVATNITIITAQFSEPMNPATLTATTFTVACTTPCIKPPTVLTVGLDATNRIATLTLANSPLVALTTYTATITTGAQSLATGLGLASPFVWNFTTVATPDTTRPSVTFTVPANAAPAVPANTRTITAVFSEEMNPVTIQSPATSFTVTCAVQVTPCVAPAGAAVSYVVGSRTAVFTLAVGSPALTPGATYTATVTTVATDLAGNTLFSPVLVPVLPQVPNPWTFTMAAAPVLDTTAPILNSTVPVNGAIDVPVGQTLSATFNETMNTLSVVNAFTLTGPGGPVLLRVVSYDPISSIATFDPTGNLAPGVYTAKIANTATDLAGNALVQPPVGGLPVPNPWSFTIPVPVVPVVPLAIDLGRAAGFGIAASRGLSSTGKTVVNGDVALSPLPTCSDASGLPANCDVRFKTSPIGLTVNGSIYFFGDPFDNGVTAAAVKTDLKTAWDQGRAKTCDKGAVGADQLGGKTLAPGVYCNANLNLATNTVLSLDAAGDTAAVWIFQVTTTLTSAAAGGPGTTRIDLLNGAQARNVWFVIGVDATIADDIIWKGNVLVGDTLTLNSRAQMLGRALAGADEAQAGGAVSILDGVTITVPQ